MNWDWSVDNFNGKGSGDTLSIFLHELIDKFERVVSQDDRDVRYDEGARIELIILSLVHCSESRGQHCFFYTSACCL
jgi:hypothetical protein